MKKLVLSVFISFILLFAFIFSSNSQVYADIINVNGIGYGYDVAKSSYANISEVKAAAPILSSTYLANANYILQDTNESFGDTAEGSDFVELNEDMSIQTGISFGLSVSEDVFTAGASSNFQFGASFNYSQYSSQYFYLKQYYFRDYKLSLPSYTTNVQAFRDNLDPYFAYRLYLLKNDTTPTTQEYYAFFDTFGTHLIASAYYGGRLDMNYAFVSNKVAFNTSIETSLKESIQVGITGLGSASASTSFSYSTSSGLTTSNTLMSYSVRAKGGSPFDVTNMSDFSTNYSSWRSSFVDSNLDGMCENSVMMEFADDGLIPLYMLIQQTYENQIFFMQMMGMMYSYITTYGDDSNYLYDSSSSFPTTYYTANKLLTGTTVYTVRNTDYLTNPKISINIFSLYGIGIDVMEQEGYSTVDLQISMQIAELANGIQLIDVLNWIYARLSEEGYYSYAISHEDGSLYTTYNFTISGIPLDIIQNDQLYLGFSMLGFFSPDWKFRSLYLEMVFHK